MSIRESNRAQRGKSALLLLGLLAIGANLRAPIVGAAPVLMMIQDTLGLTSAAAGILTTLPLLAFAAISPTSPLLARACGLERALLAALLLVACGVVARSLGPVWCLYLGTWIIGSGVAIGNVLLPSLAKRDFADKAPAVTGACAVATASAAALTSATIVPLANLPGWGWPLALASSIVFPLAAMLLWLPQLAHHTSPSKDTRAALPGRSIWSSTLAWQVTMYMGTNSLMYYITVSWLSSMLTAFGFSAAQAGTLQGLMQIAAVLPGFLLAPLVGRTKDQSGIAIATAALMALGIAGFLLAPTWSAAWAMSFGAGSGAGLVLALMFMSLRTDSAPRAAALSGMSQSVGYFLAAFGPPLAGETHDFFGSWTIPLVACLVLAAAMAGFGALAGRSRQIVSVGSEPAE